MVKINQEMVLNWFGLQDQQIQTFPESINNWSLNEGNITGSSDLSLETFRIIVQSLWNKYSSGLSLTDIEEILFVIAFIRFLIIAIRYNVKTSFYITCIGIVASYLWYRHLLDLTLLYKTGFLFSRFTRRLYTENILISKMHRGIRSEIGYREGFDNPFMFLQFSFLEASKVNGVYRIDPISMLFAKIPETLKLKLGTDNLYYMIYRDAIPWTYQFFRRESAQLSSLAAYTFFTRINKRLCPYLIRWHWTFIILLDFVERPFYELAQRLIYYHYNVLIPQTQDLQVLNTINPRLWLEVDLTRVFIIALVTCHIAFVLFAMLHAICGQYFYFPFLTENVELHIGPRDKSSIYSGGGTAWQEEKKKLRISPKIWYGWFGKGTDRAILGISGLSRIQNFIKMQFKKLKKQFLKNLRKRFEK